MTSLKETDQSPDSPWSIAERRCWAHVEAATHMMKVLGSLRGLACLSVIPIMSDIQPTIMISPDRADDLLSIKATCRYIKHALMVNETIPWTKLPINDEWVLRLKTGEITIDIMTRLPAIVESPIEL